MKLQQRTLVLTLIAALTAGAAFAADIKVNGTTIPADRLQALIQEQKSRGAPDSPELEKAAKEELIRREVLSQEATKKGFDKKPEVQAQIALAAQAITLRAYMQDWVKNNPISDAELKQEYDRVKAEMGDKEYKARHILVKTEKEATDIIAKLKSGKKFADLAKASQDPGSKDKGGELGWNVPASYVKPFSDAMVKLEKGKYTTEPVKSDFGYHVIMLEDVREAKGPTFEEVKPQIQQRLQGAKVEAMVKDLRDKAKVTE